MRKACMTVLVVAALYCVGGACCREAGAASIWIEGEDATQKNVAKHGWYDNVKKDGMSGGQWLSHYDKQKAGTATYRFEAPEAGEYTFWWRGNVLLARVSYALNGADFLLMSFAEKRGEYSISDRPDHRSLAWVKVGKAALRKGENTITFRFDSEIANHGGIDCFCFDNGSFIPSGANKPRAAPGTTEEKLAPPDQAIWIEGEDATEKKVTKHGWYDSVKKDGMSAGQWLSHYDKQNPGTATYRFEAAQADEYTFWWRGNVLLSHVLYSLNGGEFVEMSFAEKRGEYMISDKPDHRSLAWVKVGKARLRKGENTITFKFDSQIANHGGIDCFCLVRMPFVPSGARKPTVAAASTAGPGDWFPVIFDNDTFSEKSVIDMSRYVEAPAGKYGFLRPDGQNLLFEKATGPIKFWGCGANLMYGRLNREQQTQRIRYLRKHGVNMVRQHPVFDDLGPLTNGQFDAKRLDEWDWWFAELKKHGIYMTWSVFYPLLIGPDDGYDPELFAELELRDKERNLRSTYGLVNVERKLQDLQIKYVTALLLHKNPYTGLRYVDDPELAVLEIQNEDCVFFHVPLSGLRKANQWPLHAKRLRQRFCAWAKAKYGTEEALKQAWGSLRPGDSLAGGELEVMGGYHLGGKGPLFEYAGQTKRAGDFVAFLTELQRAFYDRREKEMRQSGYKGVTVTTAWRAGGPAADPANLYCDTACDMIDRHNYIGGGAGGHRIKEGDVNNLSHLGQPGSGLLSIGLYQVENRPFCSTEWTQLPPNQWKAEAAPLVAFYGMGLQGWDASYHFLNSRAYPGDGWPNLSSYVTDTPHYIGQFPALFFAVWHNHLKEAPVVASRHLKLHELFLGIDPLGQDFTGGDLDVKALRGELATPMEALAIGKVTTAFDNAPSIKADLSAYWDKTARIVRSVTGELVWDYGRQVVTVQSEKTQGIIGRAGAGTFELPGVRAAISTPFVSLLFTPLDDKPLAQSSRILITAMAQDIQSNARYSEDGKKLLTLGAPPLLMEPVQATIKLRGATPAAVNVLDVYGVPTGKTVKLEADGSFSINGTYETCYYEAKR